MNDTPPPTDPTFVLVAISAPSDDPESAERHLLLELLFRQAIDVALDQALLEHSTRVFARCA